MKAGEKMDILLTENLKKYYGEGDTLVKALDGVSLTVGEGEFLAVVGTSGSGKSTLLHMLGGLYVPTSGKVVVDGRDISGMERDELTVFRRRKIGFVFQNYNLLPVMNVYENIVLPIRLDGIEPDGKYVDRIISALGLEKKKYQMPGKLSGGQQQRVARICFRQLSGDYRSEADGLHAGLAEDNFEESAVFRGRHRQNAAGNKHRQQADHQRRL